MSKISFAVYSMIVTAAKKIHFSATAASALHRPEQVFQVVRGILHFGLQKKMDCSKACCDHCAQHFVDKISHIHSDVDSKLSVTELDGTSVPISPVVWDTFQFTNSVDADRIRGSQTGFLEV